MKIHQQHCSMRSRHGQWKNVQRTSGTHDQSTANTERERYERSAPGQGGGRTRNMAAGAPVPAFRKSVSRRSSRLKPEKLRFRFVGRAPYRIRPRLRTFLPVFGPFRPRFGSADNGFEINLSPCTGVAGTVTVANPLPDTSGIRVRALRFVVCFFRCFFIKRYLVAHSHVRLGR